MVSFTCLSLFLLMFFRFLVVFLLILITVCFLFLFFRPVRDPVALLSEPSINAPVLSDKHTAMPVSAIPTADYYQTIIDNNIFRPLGWRSPVKQPQYELLGTTIYVDAYRTQAMILDLRLRVLLHVGVDEKVGDFVVKQIEAKRVILLSAADGDLILSCRYRLFH